MVALAVLVGPAALVKLDIAIVAHKDRLLMARKLETAVGAALVVWDRGYGARDTHERAWQELARGVSGPDQWGMVIEDDAMPCYRFRACMIESLRNAPTSVVSAYLGRGRPPDWQDSIARVMANQHADWLIAKAVLHGVGLAVRGDQLRDMVAMLCPDRAHQRRKVVESRWLEPMDEAMDGWVRDRGIAVGYQHPSLLNHDLTVPSLLGVDRVRTHAVTVDGLRAADMGHRTAWWWEAKERWNKTCAVIPAPVPQPTP